MPDCRAAPAVWAPGSGDVCIYIFCAYNTNTAHSTFKQIPPSSGILVSQQPKYRFSGLIQDQEIYTFEVGIQVVRLNEVHFFDGLGNKRVIEEGYGTMVGAEVVE